MKTPMGFLALRHLLSRKTQTVLTLLGIVLGAGGYVIFSSIQLGFQEFMKDRLIENSGHITISSREEYITAESIRGVFFPGKEILWRKAPSGRRESANLQDAGVWMKRLESMKDVVSFAPVVTDSFTVSSGSFSKSVTVKGIDAARQVKVTNIGQDITQGSLENLMQGTSVIIAGIDLMKFLGVSMNDTVNIINGDGDIYPVKIIGVYDSGDRRANEGTVLASLSTVQKMMGEPGRISRIVVKIKDVNLAAETATRWSRGSSDRIESWDQANANFLSMTGTQDMVRNFTTATFIIIVSFGIYNILNMVVNQKKREIAILRSMGYTGGDTVLLFLLQGILIAVAGSMAGMVLGYAACAYIETIPLPGRGRDHMMVSWNMLIYLKGFLLVTLSSALASFFPARAAGRLSPIDIIRGTI